MSETAKQHGKDEPNGSDSDPTPNLAAVSTDGSAGSAKRTEVDSLRLESLAASPGPGLTAGAPVSTLEKPESGCAQPPAAGESEADLTDADALDMLIAERDKLRAFKAYVHKRLDDAGVPVDPESPHKAEGCRIGGRLDLVLEGYEIAHQIKDALQALMNEINVNYEPRNSVAFTRAEAALRKASEAKRQREGKS